MVSLLALSFGLFRKAWLTDDYTAYIWFVEGLYVLGGTIGAAIERLIAPRRSGIVGVLVAALVVSLVIWYSFLLASNCGALP